MADSPSKHEAKQIFCKHESDGILAVLMRCCDDPSTDSWHTIYVQAETSDEEIQGCIAHAKMQCEAQHGARERARAIINRGIS